MATIRLKNVFGEPFKQSYFDLKLSAKPTAFSGGMAVSNTQVAFPWEVGGGGLITLIDIAKLGRDSGSGCINLRGHTGAIQDIVFNEFDYNILASASDDCSVKVWDINGNTDGTFKANLTGHTKKTTNVVWNNATDFVLLSGSLDNTVRIWNVEKQAEVLCVPVDGQYSYCNWSYDGETVVVATKEGMVSLVDPRGGSVTNSFNAHESHKATSAIWLGGNYANDLIATTGYVGNQTRQIRVWDSRNTSSPLVSKDVDSSPGPLIPHWDSATGLLTVAGKGDLTVRIFQYLENDLNRAGEIKCAGTVKLFGFAPNTACDKSRCELGRLFYSTNCKEINPISIVVLRRNSEAAMGEIYGSLKPRRRTLAMEWQNNNLTATVESHAPAQEEQVTMRAPSPVSERDMTPTGRMFTQIFKETGAMNIKYRPGYTDVAMIDDLAQMKDRIDELIASLKKMHNIAEPLRGLSNSSNLSATPFEPFREAPTPHSSPERDIEPAFERVQTPKTPLQKQEEEGSPVTSRSQMSGVKAAIAAMEARAQAHANKQASFARH